MIKLKSFFYDGFLSLFTDDCSFIFKDPSGSLELFSKSLLSSSSMSSMVNVGLLLIMILDRSLFLPFWPVRMRAFIYPRGRILGFWRYILATSSRDVFGFSFGFFFFRDLMLGVFLFSAEE